MTEERRTYRTKAVQQEPIKREETTVAPETKATASSPYHNITGLFRSKSGKADTVRVTDAILEKLQEIQVGDTIGVSLGSKDRLSLWYRESDERQES